MKSKFFLLIFVLVSSRFIFADNVDELIKAVRENSIEKVKELLNKEVSVNAQNKSDGITALMAAAESGNKEIVKFLLSRGADVNIKSILNLTALIAALQKKSDIEIVKLLLDKGADVNVEEMIFGATPLFYAVTGGNKNIVQLLIEKGANVNASFDMLGAKFTALVQAVKNNHKEIIPLLVMAGANIEDINKLNPKMYEQLKEFKREKVFNAIKQNNLNELKRLVKLGFSLGIKDENGSTPLHIAIESENIELAKWILSVNPSLIAVKNNADQTPIHLAIGTGRKNYEFLKKLIASGQESSGIWESFTTAVKNAFGYK